jgi:SAM-dependent methyltransferase
MREQFEHIYAINLWGGSGEGSRPRHTHGYARFLARFLRENQVRSVLDLGCGDWQFSRYINWSGIRYYGYDVVRSVVERNQALFAASNISFHAYEGDLDQLPAADLLIAKDVLQHWSNQSVFNFLPRLKNYPLALLTNCVRPDGQPTENIDDMDGGSRPLDLRRPPFNLEAELVYEFTNDRPLLLRPFMKLRWRKYVLLVRSSPQAVPSTSR